jgi:hypothetical protein
VAERFSGDYRRIPLAPPGDFSEPSLFVLKSVLGVAPVAGVKPLRHLRSHRCAPGCDGVEAERVRLSPDWLAGTNRTGQSLALQTKARLPSLSWAVAHAHSQPAYCVQPQPASRTAQPWFSSVPAWEVAIVSWSICGDAGGRIKPPPGPFLGKSHPQNPVAFHQIVTQRARSGLRCPDPARRPGCPQAAVKSGPHGGCKIAPSQSSFRSERRATIHWRREAYRVE